MKILVLVIVSFDKPVYYDMLRVWRERILTNDCCDVWFIQCKSDAEWIGDIVNDIGELRSLRAQPDGCMTPPLSGDTMNDILNTPFQQSQSLCDRFELDRKNKTLFIRGDECLIPGILHKTVEALSFFLLEEGSKGMSAAVPFIWRTNLSSVLDFDEQNVFSRPLSRRSPRIQRPIRQLQEPYHCRRGPYSRSIGAYSRCHIHL
jgi:hypothetical protein